MKLRNAFRPHLAAGAAAIALAVGWTAGARADIAYAYAEQTITGLTVGVAGTLSGTSTSAAAAVNGSGVSTNNPTDTPEAYVGAAPPAPQNSYVKYSTLGGGPQAGDFTRGDAIITGAGSLFTTGASASNVAESAISTGGTGVGLETGNGNWNVAGTFTTTASTVTVSYNFANDIVTTVTGAGIAQASFKTTISIKDQHGHEVDATPVELNTALSAPPNGPEIISSGSGSATLSLASLTAGDVFSIAITGTELSSVSLAAVPEPGVMVLSTVAFAVAGLGALARRRRSAK